jgi:hypothetical protein
MPRALFHTRDKFFDDPLFSHLIFILRLLKDTIIFFFSIYRLNSNSYDFERESLFLLKFTWVPLAGPLPRFSFTKYQ